ncbi:MAG: S8 family serine peptidase, partial [bacterium]
ADVRMLADDEASRMREARAGRELPGVSGGAARPPAAAQARARSAGPRIGGPVALALALGMVGVPSGIAADEIPPILRDITGGSPAFIAAGAGPVNVMLELEATPAARVYAASEGLGPRSRITATRTAVDRVETQQASVRARLTAPATRATVLYETSRVYAGIAVRTDASRVDALAAIPGVKAIPRLVPKERDNFIAVPLIQAPSAWVDAGKTGRGVTLGVMDTGIDYTHADFGGPGTPEAYDAALAAKEAGQSPDYPDPAKVAGGYDFAGNAYNAEDPDSVPQPDDNPLDCEGHGTHVAGSAGGYGVNADGSTFEGPWDASTPFDTMGIAPGVAPEVTLYSLKVFGCEGSTLLVPEALDWAVDPNGDGDLSDHLDIVNMSLGADFGSPQDPDSVASDNAVDAGVSVIAAAGNAGDIYEISGSPAIATKALSVAASEDRGEITDGFSASIAGSARTFPASLSADYPWSTGSGVADAPLVELGDWSEPPSAANNIDGCSPFSAADAARVAGKVVLLWWDDNEPTRRCGSVGRSGNATAAGATGAVLGSSLTLFAVGITGSKDIPVVLSNSAGTSALHDALGQGRAVTVTLNDDLRNTERIIVPVGPSDPTDMMTSFTSRGTALAGNVKPDVTAPGSSIFSAAVGTGDQGASKSGTSMATPMTAGLAALLIEARPSWSAQEIKAGIMNTADHDLFLDPGQTGPRYDVLRAGSGRVDALSAVRNRVLAYVVDDPGAVSVSFGVLDVKAGTVYSASRTVRIADKRTSGSARTYAVGLTALNTLPGASFVVSPDSVTLRPGQSADIVVRVKANGTRLLHRADPTITLDPYGIGLMRDFLTDISALLTVSKPTGGEIRVPVFAAPRPASEISTQSVVDVSGTGLETGTLTMAGTPVNPRGDVGYEMERSRVSALQLVADSERLPNCMPDQTEDCVATEDQASADLRYLGFTSDARFVEDPLDPANGAMAYFGVASWAPWRTAASISEFDVFLDTDKDGAPDAVLYNTRLGETDILVSSTVSLREGEGFAFIDIQLLNNLAGNADTAKMHSNAMTLPLSLAALANPTDEDGNPLPPFISEGQTSISYWVETYGSGVLTDSIASAEDPLQVDLVEPPLTAFNDTASMPARALPGRQLTVTMDPSTARGAPRLLLIHHLNRLGQKAQVVAVR